MTSTTVMPKAIYVGAPQVYDFLKKLRSDWEFQPNVPDIASLWQGLELGAADQEKGTVTPGALDNNAQVLLVLDAFFDERGADRSFEQLVASMAPYCMVGIINYKPQHNEAMRERIESESYTLGVTDLKYYFIDTKKPGPSLDSAVARFISETTQVEAAAILAGKEIDLDAEGEDDEDPAEKQLQLALEEQEAGESDYLGQVVAITSSKGGSGKSTVAITLATYLAHASHNSVREGLESEPLKVIILDLDVRDGQLGFLTNNSKPTVIQLRVSGITPETVDQTVIHSARLKCDLLLAPKRPRNADDTPPEFYVELIQSLRQKYDYVILDTSVNYLDPLLEKVAYPMADQIVFVTDIVINSVFSMTRWIQEVTKPKTQMGMGISKNKIGIVVNKSLGNVAMPGEKIYQSALGIPVITPIPSNPKIMASAANTQQMDLLLQHQDIYSAVRRLAKAIVGKKYKLSNSVDK